MRKGRKSNRTGKRLSDQEILEWFLNKFTSHRSVAEERKDLWKATLISALVWGPFATSLFFIGWFGLVPFWLFSVPIGTNAVILLLLASFFHFTSKKFENSPQEKQVGFQGVMGFSIVSWEALYASLMVLLCCVGIFVQVYERFWWILPAIYTACGTGLWWGRKALLRAIVEGPEAHPWFRPIQLLFSVSVGFCIFTAAVFRILGNLLEHIHADLPFLFLTALSLAVSIMFLGLAMVGGIIGYLHYQRLRGSSKLKV